MSLLVSLPHTHWRTYSTCDHLLFYFTWKFMYCTHIWWQVFTNVVLERLCAPSTSKSFLLPQLLKPLLFRFLMFPFPSLCGHGGNRQESVIHWVVGPRTTHTMTWNDRDQTCGLMHKGLVFHHWVTNQLFLFYLSLKFCLFQMQKIAITAYVTFSEWLLSLSNIHFSFLDVFSALLAQEVYFNQDFIPQHRYLHLRMQTRWILEKKTS